MKKKSYICASCGASFLKWQGRCPRCGEWGTVEEIDQNLQGGKKRRDESGEKKVFSLDQITNHSLLTLSSGSSSLDSFLGKGLVAGSVILLGGEPGVGKSTFLLQLVGGFLKKNQRALYVSGEESLPQLKHRADRLEIHNSSLLFMNTTSVEEIINILEEKTPPPLVIIDSIQTIKSSSLQGIPGGVSQIRECASLLYEKAKKNNITLLLVSHITKEGYIAGPKLLEHMVDVVLYLEGDRLTPLRILKIEKNRFGPSHNILLLEMGEKGLQIVSDPSTFFLTSRNPSSSGSALAMVMEGQRPFVIEVQALVVPSHLSSPRRTSLGIDINRLHLLLAILEKRLGVGLSKMDVYAKVGAGIKIGEPGMDLGLCAAILSSYFDRPLPPRSVLWGEVDINGQIRGVRGEEKRLSQASSLKFHPILCPNIRRGEKSCPYINEIKNIQELPLRLWPLKKKDSDLKD